MQTSASSVAQPTLAEPRVIALVEFDLKKMRVRIVLAREAIKERLRELEHQGDHLGERRGVEDTSR